MQFEKGKRLEIKIKDTLLSNTTYTLNFGNAIADLNEQNSIPDFQFVFSTGPEIDSLKIGGQIIDAFNRDVESNLLVLLHRQPAVDSAFQKNLPTYVSRTDKDGRFLITNIREGSYRMYALKDANTNYLFDRKDEKIAFLNEEVMITDSIQEITLFTFEEATTKQFLEKQSAIESRLMLDFKLPLTNFKFYSGDSLDLPEILDLSYNNKNDSVLFWWKEQNKLKIKLAVQDSGKFSDTLTIKIDSLAKTNSLSMSNQFIAAQNYYETPQLKFNRPLKSIDSGKIQLLNPDSLNVPFEVTIDSNNNTKANFKFDFKPETKYRLLILPEAFTGIYGRTTDTLKRDITFNTVEDFGTLTVLLKDEYTEQKIIQLTNAKGKVLKEQVAKNNKVTFRNISPSDYRVKMIIDSNKNNRWDSGNYEQRLQAEKTFLFDENITVRKNWDKEITWIMDYGTLYFSIITF